MDENVSSIGYSIITNSVIEDQASIDRSDLFNEGMDLFKTVPRARKERLIMNTKRASQLVHVL